MLKPVFCALILLGISVVANQAHATGETNSNSTIDVPQPRYKAPRKYDEITLSISDESYLNRGDPPAGISDYEFLSTRVRAGTEDNLINVAIDLGGTFAVNVENYSNVEVPEAFATWTSNAKSKDPSDGHFTITLGRKKEAWTRLDSEWTLGLTQPLNEFDGLRPTEQGFTGIFGSYHKEGFEVLVMGGLIYIPNQGAQYTLDGGQFSTNSPWFNAPPSQMVLFNTLTPVQYTLETPSTGSVVNHQYFGTLIRYGHYEGEGFYAQASVLHKPRNDLTLPFDGQLNISSNTSFGDVTVFPTVVYHTVTAVDLDYSVSGISFGLSAISDVSDPNNVTDPNLTYQDLAPLYMVSPNLEFKLFPSQTWGPHVSLAYLHSIGGQVSTEGPNSSNTSVFGSRTMYSEASSVAVQSMLLHSHEWRVDWGLRWIEEFDELGSILMNDFRIGYEDSWRLSIYADLLGSRQPTSDTATFIARYRGNDRAGIKLSYVF
jgi:hypothetical protein